MQALESDASAGLRFPGKVATDAAGKLLFIADTGHSRVLVCELSSSQNARAVEAATVVAQIGSGAAGHTDGAFNAAALRCPQGLAYHEEEHCLYIADAGNHCLRCADLAARTVTTISLHDSSSDATAGLSPWALQLDRAQQRLYVALAGQHQIWRLDMQSWALEHVSGTGHERNQNGATGLQTAWAQPSGLALCPDGTTMCAGCHADLCLPVRCTAAALACAAIVCSNACKLQGVEDDQHLLSFAARHA